MTTMATIPMNMHLLTASRLKVARRCQREHHYEYGKGYRALTEDANLRFGSLFHAGLEAWWTSTDPATRLDDALDAMAGESDPFERVKAETLMAGYDARWGAERLEVLAVEKKFEAPLVNPLTRAASRTWALGGKIDAVVRELDTGRVLVVEHKTTSEDVRPGSDYWRRLKIDGQVSIYFAGARELGFDVEACLYDVISKPGMRPLKATPVESRKYTKDGRLYAAQRDRDETPEEYRARLLEDVAGDPTGYFARGDVVRLEQELSEAAWDAWALGRQLREADLAGRYPRNPDACSRFGRTCQFFGVCTGEDSLDNAERFRRMEDIHPELAEEAAQ